MELVDIIVFEVAIVELLGFGLRKWVVVGVAIVLDTIIGTDVGKRSRESN